MRTHDDEEINLIYPHFYGQYFNDKRMEKVRVLVITPAADQCFILRVSRSRPPLPSSSSCNDSPTQTNTTNKQTQLYTTYFARTEAGKDILWNVVALFIGIVFTIKLGVLVITPTFFISIASQLLNIYLILFQRPLYLSYRTPLFFFLRMYRIISIATVPFIFVPGGPTSSMRAMAALSNPFFYYFFHALSHSGFGVIALLGARLRTSLQIVYHPLFMFFGFFRAAEVCFEESALPWHQKFADKVDILFQRLIPTIELVHREDDVRIRCITTRFWFLFVTSLAFPLAINLVLDDLSRWVWVKERKEQLGLFRSHSTRSSRSRADRLDSVLRLTSPLHPWALLHSAVWVVFQSYIAWVLLNDGVPLLASLVGGRGGVQGVE